MADQIIKSVEVSDHDRRVLVVDDDQVFAVGLVDILQSHGCSVAVAHSAEQARSVIQDFDAWVALVDICLGSDNGLDLIADLKQIRPDMCCVMISAYAELESAVRAVREGAYDYLRKPVASSDLLATVEKCFEVVRLRGQKAAAEEAVKIGNTELERRNKRLAELTETAQRFVDNVSHEFRTPLTVIKEFAEIIADGLAGPVNNDQEKYLGIIRNSVHDLSQMVDDLLDCSRLKAATLRVDRRRCTVAEIMESVLPMLTSKAAAKSIQVAKEIAPELNDVFADREKAVRALVNLATNAIKYSPENSDVVLWADESGDRGVRIGVADNGLGMSKEDLAVIFGRFKQAGNAYHSSTRGLGLGLHIAKELTELNLGQIQVESEPGKGSTFWFSLPRCDWREIVHSYLDLPGEMAEDIPVSAMAVTLVEAGAPIGQVRGFLAAQCRPMDLILGEDDGDRLILLGRTDVPQDWARRLHAARDKVVSDDALAHVPEFRIEVVGTWRCPGERVQAEADTLGLLQGRKKSAC